MQLIRTAILCATLTLPGVAHAQVNKVEGASAAGLCASSLEFIAGVRSSAGVATQQELARLGRLRDLFLSLETFKKGEVEAYATAWSKRMGENFASAQSNEQQSAIANEIGSIAVNCQRKMVQQIKDTKAARAGNSGQAAPAQPVPAQPLQAPPAQPFVLTPQ